MHTFLVALVRYMFIVFNGHVSNAGKNRVVGFVCKVGLATALIMAAVSTFVTLHKEIAPWIWVNQCYGRKAENNIDSKFCSMDEMAINLRYGDWSNAVQDLLFGGCIFNWTTHIMLTSNIPEAIMYSHIYWQLKR